ncbi:glycosyltransferase family 2 protein [Thiorhodococcus mannitoliphagus]|uniref:Glycosyltransferase family 2 protein n=1 Tax=Thiorhodococcus mannitoliphagus TaxID=329406 RepID=A0A6P1DRZ0_9GAMM|nr:glycosyltransferase family 2 protein [Thiorhodococcus mannitoliphagus]NEX19456.1 glycosyltransferase family 2 protein [Thiorhodococcus mannitoliphagus]
MIASAQFRIAPESQAGAGVERAGERVAVIIVDYRAGELLTACLEGLSRQTRPADRVIVVDNGGAQSALPAPRGCPAIELIDPGYNTGFAEGNNLALARTTDCDWVALLNPDAVPDPDWLEQLLLASRHYPGSAAFGSRMYSDDARTRLDGSGDVMHVSGLVWRRDHGRPARGLRLRADEVFSPCAAAALYRRDLLARLGGFDEEFFCYAEDVDLGFRIRLAGYVCRYVPQAQVVHQGSALTGVRSDFALYHGHRNLLWLFVKNMPLPLLVVLLPVHLLMHLVVVLRYLPEGRAAVLIKAKRDALSGLARNWRKRRRIQRQRRVGMLSLLRAMSLW